MSENTAPLCKAPYKSNNPFWKMKELKVQDESK